jgi:hypothetical protein
MLRYDDHSTRICFDPLILATPEWSAKRWRVDIGELPAAQSAALIVSSEIGTCSPDESF